MPEEATYHIPVLLKESIDGLNIQSGGIYVDVTFGGGGHSAEILRRLGGKGHLYSFDQDADEEQESLRKREEGENGNSTDNFTFVRSNFRYLYNWMRYYGIEAIDGLIADLGVSSHHFDDFSRGFSFRFDAPLDMRMNKRAGKTAAEILEEYSEQQLADIFYLYGELKQARRLAATICKARAGKPIKTTNELVELASPLLPKDREKNEMTALKDMLAAATKLIKPEGRLSVITYHSLEDRLVKNFMKAGNAEGKVSKDFFGKAETPCTLINSKVIIPSDEEQQQNPRSRSAKLRIAEKK